ncbi:hypothetical protein BU24DRAFT_161468 [Aaosphaeria arxii CBS 175.79]|uniref:Uncharacterized protein n=1 Tax=Aaosphaeria arxii CBS 175.79 TaxID=1450172 RepID=A0A6A5XY31_9PLEO|nr:uncharacterized protein BU24DRAFT_161468 [Aaosphaeria arxii CBS 175.79]KAF2017859.1 hypothetical protein BU24DRAFT_161468 [Aaosphaeria arxii CBS 175.79]
MRLCLMRGERGHVCLRVSVCTISLSALVPVAMLVPMPVGIISSSIFLDRRK